jgi:hypothetical protein
MRMFTYEWLGMPSPSGILPVLDRSVTASTSLKAAITDAKSQLKKKAIFPAGQTYGVRILNNNSVLVWAWDIDGV